MVQLGQKKILNSKFSLTEMIAIEDDAEARKYFILRYFVPIAYTIWQSTTNGGEDWMLLHIINNQGLIVPYISAAREENLRVLTNHLSLNATISQQHQDIVKRVSVVESNIYALSAELQRRFGKCFSSKSGVHMYLDNSPLVATLSKSVNALGDASLKLNVVIRQRDKVRNERSLCAQIHYEKSLDMTAFSFKYKKTYNIVTGEWETFCDDSECIECIAVKNSIAKLNAYDDPDTILEEI